MDFTRIKKMTKIAIVFLFISCTYSCGVSTSSLTGGEQNFVVEMYGVFQEPVGTEGAYEPKWQNYLLTDVYLTKKDDATTVDLMTTDSETIRIIDREQIIFSADISEYDAVTFSSLTVVVDPSVVVAGKTTDENVITLDTGDITLTKDFTVEKAQAVTVLLKVKWKNTISLDDASGQEVFFPPGFDISIK